MATSSAQSTQFYEIKTRVSTKANFIPVSFSKSFNFVYLKKMEDILKNYNQSIVDVHNLKKKVKKKLAQYETSVKEANKKPKYEDQDDGWITVHHKGGRDPTKKHTKNKKKRKTEKLINFYAFEVKESKLKKHKELLEKFEEDKRRLAKMREQRKFKL